MIENYEKIVFYFQKKKKKNVKNINTFLKIIDIFFSLGNDLKVVEIDISYAINHWSKERRITVGDGSSYPRYPRDRP